MKQTVNLYEFRDAFQSMNRGNNFSYEGLEVLFDYLEEYEDSTGEEIELDVIALCCDYSEDAPEDIASNYCIDIEGLDEDEIKETVREYIEHHSSFVGETDSGTFVYQVF